MIILKYELKRHRKYILGWAIALALCVFVMTPTYYSFMDVSTGDLYETLGTSDFYKGVGVSMEYLTSPLGIYAFLTSFFMIASGIFGMHFGIAIHTKECSERTSEYLFTKPHTRKTIYWAKAFTVFFGVVVVSMVYLLASFLALALFRSGIDWGEFFLIALSLMLVTLFHAATLIIISRLHFGQYSGKFSSTVLSQILILVLLLQLGHNSHSVFFILCFSSDTRISRHERR